MTTKRDYYETLGINRNANEEEVRKAFRKKAMEFHPDRNKEPGADAKFKEVNEAYQILSDPNRRAKYDQFGHAGVNSSGGQGFEGFDVFGGFGDIFDAFFGELYAFLTRFLANCMRFLTHVRANGMHFCRMCEGMVSIFDVVLGAGYAYLTHFCANGPHF